MGESISSNLHDENSIIFAVVLLSDYEDGMVRSALSNVFNDRKRDRYRIILTVNNLILSSVGISVGKTYYPCSTRKYELFVDRCRIENTVQIIPREKDTCI